MNSSPYGQIGDDRIHALHIRVRHHPITATQAPVVITPARLLAAVV